MPIAGTPYLLNLSSSAAVAVTTATDYDVCLYYGHWWLRLFLSSESDKYRISAQALEGTGAERLALLDLKLTLSYTHIYQPGETGNN